MNATQTFPSELLQASISDRISYFENCTIRHAMLDSVTKTVEQSLSGRASPTVHILAGPTGVGKTTVATTLYNRMLKTFEDQMIKDQSFRPVMKVNAIAPNGSSFNWKDCFIRILNQADEPLINKKVVVPMQLTLFGEDRPITTRERNVADALRRSVEQCLCRRKTRILIIDEAHHILMVNNPKRMEFQFEALKSLAIETKCTIVLVGTYRLLDIRDQSGQLVRRSEIVHFPRYDHRNEKEKAGFVQALNTLAGRLPLESYPDLQAHAGEIYHRTIGCIGILKEWLSRAYARHLESGNKHFNWEYIESFALSVKALETIAAEALDGEEKLRDKPIDDLVKLLDYDYQAKSRPSTAQCKDRPKVGKRSPVRDKVGSAYAAI